MATIQNGIVTTDFGGDDYSNSVAIQKDGKILVAGYSNNVFALARYNPNGSLDTSFDSDGKVTTAIGSSDVATSIIVQPDGKLVVAGYSINAGRYDFTLVRYNANGSLDNDFDGDGKISTSLSAWHDMAFSVIAQLDGKLVVAGSSLTNTTYTGYVDFALVRYNTDGSLDTSFDGDGRVITTIIDSSNHYDEARSITIQPDGKLIVAGYSNTGSRYSFALVRYNSDGSLDSSFDGDGKLTTDIGGSEVYSVTLQSDGKILVAGYGNHDDFALARYDSNGSLDSSFDSDGILTTDFGNNDRATAITLQTDGKILVAGYSDDSTNYNFAVLRYNSNGSLDNSFDGDGKLITAIGSNSAFANAMTLQADGKILVSGYSQNGSNYDFTLIRYNPDGSLDETFNGIDTTPPIPLLPTWQETLTKSGGYYSTFADLSKAAYQLGSDETHNGQGDNFIKPYADEAWARVNANWNVLTSKNLNVNTGTLGTDGIYHNANAAAFAAQCENTLVLSFRGTNDNDADPAKIPYFDAKTPDEIAWTDMGNTLTGHYGQFFDFIQAVDKYVADNGIQNVYVTGHSLGGAMVLAYMLDHPKVEGSLVNYEAVTFAAPGYNMIGAPDARIVDVEMDGDIVHSFGYHQGHIVTINSDIKHTATGLSYGKYGSTEYHSMDIYREAAHALDNQLPNTSINTNQSIHGVNLTSFDDYWNTEVTLPMFESTGTKPAWNNSIAPRYIAMEGNNKLSGIGSNIMLGGVGDDDYRVDNPQDIIIEKTNSGTDSVSSGISFILPDNVENLTLQNKTGGISPFNFTQNLNATGNAKNNVLDGNDAKNTLQGLNGNDLLKGEKGKDVLIGGGGRDVLNGGDSADTFKFKAVSDSSVTDKTRDVIIDFNHAEKDKIDLSTIDANITTTANDAFLTLGLGETDVTFTKTNALYFNTFTHILYGNNDIDKAADFSIELSGVTTLSKADFVL